jgi:hypothetical protein
LQGAHQDKPQKALAPGSNRRRQQQHQPIPQKMPSLKAMAKCKLKIR